MLAIFLKRLKRDEAAATAVEFALILPVLVVMLLSIVEIGVLGFVSNNLDDAVGSAGRAIRTGRSDGPSSAQQFKDLVCSRMVDTAATCDSKLTLSVEKYPDFATMAAAPSHIVILLANRAGTINRLLPRGNGAHRPIRPAHACRAASLHALCPAPRGVIRPRSRPRIRTPVPLHSGQNRARGPRSPGPGKPVRRCPRGAVHWAERKAWMGTSSGVRSPERPGDGGSPGASAA